MIAPRVARPTYCPIHGTTFPPTAACPNCVHNHYLAQAAAAAEQEDSDYMDELELRQMSHDEFLDSLREPSDEGRPLDPTPVFGESS